MSGYRMLLSAAIASAVAAFFSLSWNMLYSEALLVDFSKPVSILAITVGSIFGTTLLFAAHFFAIERFGNKAERWLNVLIMLLTFVSTLSCFAYTLPLETKRPDLFIGLVVPMHFFPALSFWALLPFFRTANGR